MEILTHILFSINYKKGKEPFHQEHMNEKLIPRIGERVCYEEGFFNFTFSKEISLDFLVENIIYRYERNEEKKLITFIDVILKSK